MSERAARESALRAADAAARRAAQSVYDRPLVIEAGAGTGKTAVLVARIAIWCLGPGWERAQRQRREPGSDADAEIAAAVLERVTALTFTEAAASEMSERTARALGALARGEPPLGIDPERLPDADCVAPRATALLGALERLEVRTIHAWCRRVLAAHPIEAGLAPDFSVDADGRRTCALVRDVLDAQLRALFARGAVPETDVGRALEPLLARGIAPSQIESLLLALLDAGVDAGALARDPASPERLAALLDRGRDWLGAWFEAGGERLAAVRGSRTRSAHAAVVELARAIGAPGDPVAERFAAVVQASANGERENAKRLEDWGRARFGRAEATALGPASEAVASASAGLAAWLRGLAPVRATGRARVDPEGLRALFAALHPLLREVEEALAARGVQSFASLLREAHRLLTGHGRVLARVRAGIDQLLVDEFQDTDALQCEILQALALDGAASERPGLFLVGDPKQSIYGWREADLAAYERFADQVAAAGGRREWLCVCFRSGAVILDEVERLIAPVMRERPGIQPPFRPLLPASPQGPGATPPRVEHWVSWVRRADGELGPPRAAAAARVEAAAIAADLVRQQRAGVAWSRMALLFRSRGDLDVYLEALRRARIPYSVEGHRGYYERREVIDAAAWLRVAADPCDALALVTWLRSPAVGVPDAALIPLWAREFPARVAELEGDEPQALAALERCVRAAARATPALPELAALGAWEELLIGALRALAGLRGALGREPADRWVERLRTASCIEVIEAARPLGHYRLANLDRFMRELVGALSDGADLGEWLESLRRSIREREAEEEGRPLESGLEAVSVRTIHQSKGLDWDHVYLVQAHKEARRAGASELRLRRSTGCWELSGLGLATPGFAELESALAAGERAERVRTLYVALTRARERLVTAGVWSARGAPERPEDAASHVHLMAFREGGIPDLAEWARVAAQRPEAARQRDAFGVEWVLLGPELEAHPPPRAAETAGAVLASPGRIDRESAALARQRAEAALRERRPRVRDASAADPEIAPAAALAARARVGAEHSGPPLPGEWASALGSTLHRLFEEFDLSAPETLRAQLAKRAGPAVERLVARAPARLEGALRSRADALWKRVHRGALLGRLEALRSHVVARELPVWLPANGAELGADGSPDPTSHHSGAIDLVYRDPETGALVIVDYKSDRVDSARDLSAHAARYATPLERYRRALCSALDLEDRPRVELWFLVADRSLVL